MATTVQELIGEIKVLSWRRIDGRRQAELIDEVLAHLDANIQARMELGSSIKEAEEEAVRSFGDPIDFVQCMADRYPTRLSLWFDRGVWRALVAVLAITASFASFGYMGQYFVSGWLTVAVAVIAVWRGGWRAPRPQIFPFLAAFLLSIPLFALAVTVSPFSENSLPPGIEPFWLKVCYHLPMGVYIGGSWMCLLGSISVTSWALSSFWRWDKRRSGKSAG